MVRVCDVVTINAPLHPGTINMFDEKLLAQDETRAHTLSIQHAARSATAMRSCALSKAENWRGTQEMSGIPQPAPKDHPWRTMPNNGMTPHMSGTSLSAQARYAAGTREILECWLEDRPMREDYVIVDGKKLAGTGAMAYTV